MCALLMVSHCEHLKACAGILALKRNMGYKMRLNQLLPLMERYTEKNPSTVIL